MAAQVWERMLRSVSRTRLRNSDHPQAIADLQSYLFLAFVHRFNRAVQQEQKHTERPELVSSSVDLEREGLMFRAHQMLHLLRGSELPRGKQGAANQRFARAAQSHTCRTAAAPCPGARLENGRLRFDEHLLFNG